MVAGRIAAWVLYTIAAAGSLIEIENASGRQGPPYAATLLG